MPFREKIEITPEPEVAVSQQLPDAVPAAEVLAARGPFFHRGPEKFYAKGVTYGPFRPNAAGEFFPPPGRVRADFALMRSLGVNSVRVYDAPPHWLADLAAVSGIALLAGISWPEHICGFGQKAFERGIRNRIRQAVTLLRGHPAVLGVLVGNEIPAPNVRWAGPRVVERFLVSLYETAKSADPERLVSYANYPSTEYLRLEAFDFYTLNLYLHDRESLRRYLAHARNLAGDRPFVLGEIGIDAAREGEARQAEILKFSLEEAYRQGTAGTFLFSFTDEWFRGGSEVTGWSFGLTDRERQRRPAARAVAEVLRRAPELPLERFPRVSVVVATYNGGRTLFETLESLTKLRYPDYEIIVVDDGSKDDSAEIARTFLKGSAPERAGNGAVRLIQQPNRGLSEARNRGIEASTGEIVAFCDSDAAADPHWLYHLVAALSDGGPAAAGVGGPNLAPRGDGRVAAAVSVSPGSPTHVLMGDHTAEHIPGCNMAFWKSALEEIGGFDPRFRSAGDDVDVCWRLQDRGHKLAFAPSGIVWHHRRNTVSGYFKQQRGYGEAEADLAAKHPDRYNSLGGALWRGRIYASQREPALALLSPRIEYGVFGSGLFQRMYEPGGPPLATLAAMPEWTAIGLAALASGLLGRSAVLTLVGTGLVCATAAVSLSRALRARLQPEEATPAARALVFWLSLAQPWVRRIGQLRKACALYRAARLRGRPAATRAHSFGFSETAFWTESTGERGTFLERFERRLSADGLPARRGSAFDRFDLEARGAPGARVLVSSVVEYHGGPKRLLRLRLQPRISPAGFLSFASGFLAVLVLGLISPGAAAGAGLLQLAAFFGLLGRVRWQAGAVLAGAIEAARESGFEPIARPESARPLPGQPEDRSIPKA